MSIHGLQRVPIGATVTENWEFYPKNHFYTKNESFLHEKCFFKLDLREMCSWTGQSYHSHKGQRVIGHADLLLLSLFVAHSLLRIRFFEGSILKIFGISTNLAIFILLPPQVEDFPLPTWYTGLQPDPIN